MLLGVFVNQSNANTGNITWDLGKKEDLSWLLRKSYVGTLSQNGENLFYF